MVDPDSSSCELISNSILKYFSTLLESFQIHIQLELAIVKKEKSWGICQELMARHDSCQC